MAKKAKKDKPVYSFMWDGRALWPEMDYDRGALAGFKQGDRVRVEVKHWRNLDRLKAYWVYLHEVVAVTECAHAAEPLHSFLKKELGIVEYVKLIDGAFEAVEGSIALENMPEAEFIAFFEAVVKLIAERLGYVKEQRAHGKDEAA